MKKFILPLIDIIEFQDDEIIRTSSSPDEQYGPNDLEKIDWPF